MEPSLLERNGFCGGKTPGPLPILVGEPVDCCPTSMGISDRDVRAMAPLLPGPDGPGPLSDADLFDLPPRWRVAVEMAKVWRDVFVGKAGAP